VNKPVKLPEIRKEEFTKAREALGLSTKELSGMACLSVRQIEQIENGESSSFYGAQVKVTAAKKVAGLLKLKEEDAFDLSEAVLPAKESVAEANLRDVAKNSAVEKKLSTEKAPEVVPAAKGVGVLNEPKHAVASPSKSGSQNKVESQSPQNSQKKIFLFLAVGAAIIFSIVNLRPLFFPEPVKEEVVLIQEVVPEPTPAAAPAEPVPEAKPVAALAEVAPVAVSADCPTPDATPINYKPEAPKKAGDMIYVQAKTAQTICVVDGFGKTQNKTLEPGIGVSVFGKPPLKVLTGGLNQVDLYYQGAKVRLGNTSNKTVILEPAEIIQPVTPLVPMAPAASLDSQPPR